MWSAGRAAVLSCAVLGLGCVRSVEARAGNWWLATTEHIRLEGDAGGEATEAAARHLEEIHRALSLTFYHCGRPDDAVVDVTYLSNDGEFVELLGPHVAGVAFDATEGLLALSPRIVVNGAHDLDQQTVFAHELVHALVRRCFPDAPHWLHEGLATVFENVQIRGDVVIAGAPSYEITDSAYAGLTEIDGFPVRSIPRRYVPRPSELRSLRVSARSDEDPHRVAGYYAGAWALTHMLALGPDTELRQRFRSYLDSLVRGEDDGEAAFEVAFYGVDLDVPLAYYLATGHFARVVRPWDPTPGPAPVLRTMTTTEAHIRLAELGLRASDRAPTELAALVDAHTTLAAVDPAWRSRALLVRAALALDPPEDCVRDAALDRPDGRDELRALAILESRAGNLTAALAACAALAVHPERRAMDLALVSGIELDALHGELALEHAEAAVALDRTDAFAWLALGRAQASGDPRTALHSLHTAANLAGHGSGVRGAAEAAIDGLRLRPATAP